MKNIFLERYQTIRKIFRALFSKQSKPFIYAAIGDSTVEGIGATHPDKSYATVLYKIIKHHRKNAEYYNFGKSGATTVDVIKNQLENLIAVKPQLVTISIGANDIMHLRSVKMFNKNLQFIISQIKDNTSAHIIVNNIPDFSLLPAFPRPLSPLAKIQIGRFNEVIYEVTKFFDVTYVDLYLHAAVYAKHFPETVAEDHFHPSDIGYALWANTIVTSIQHLFYPKKKVAFYSSM